MSSLELHTCFVCPAQTSTRCPGCAAAFFCCKDHQKLGWSTHRWMCEKENEPFSFPPMSAEELADLDKVKDEPFDLFASFSGTPTTSPLPAWNQGLITASAHRHLCRCRTEGVLSRSRYCPRNGMMLTFSVFRLFPNHALIRTDEFFNAYSPFLRQYLLLMTLRAKAGKDGVWELIQEAERRCHEALARIETEAATKFMLLAFFSKLY
ncbi:hypothetical protein JCM8547_007525 [Rhodosporidiobolus lusitaniae]